MNNEIELKRQLQLLKGSNGEYVLSTITDLHALIDCITNYAERLATRRATEQAIWELQRAYEYHPDYLHDMLIKRLKELTALLTEEAKQ